jgi:hypothetical protein
LYLDDTELDGLFDAVDGEASMELATPLMPTAVLLRSSPSSDMDLHDDSERGDRDDIDSDTGTGPQDMVLDDSDDIPNSDAYEEREPSLGLEHTNFSYEFQLGGDDDGRTQWPHSVDLGEVHDMIDMEGSGLLNDDSLHDDIDDSSDGGAGFYNSSPSAPLLREGESEVQSDDDDRGGVNDYEEHQHQDGTDKVPLLAPHQQHEYHDINDQECAGPEELNGEGEETVLVAAHSQSREFQPTSFHYTNDHDLNNASHSHARPLSPTESSDEILHTESILAKAERELTAAQDLLDQGENTLRTVEASLSLDSPSSPSSES